MAPWVQWQVPAKRRDRYYLTLIRGGNLSQYSYTIGSLTEVTMILGACADSLIFTLLLSNCELFHIRPRGKSTSVSGWQRFNSISLWIIWNPLGNDISQLFVIGFLWEFPSYLQGDPGGHLPGCGLGWLGFWCSSICRILLRRISGWESGRIG